MGMWARWRAGRDRRRLASRYLDALPRAVAPSDAVWLCDMGVGEEIARRELAFALRAVALIVAERDALDDRTASDVAHRLAPEIQREFHANAGTGRAWDQRWRAYTGALAVRGDAHPPAVRLARVLLGGAGLVSPGPEQVARASVFVTDARTRANESLRQVFGVASLPDDIRPSALGR
jgi:hypothetical protein